MTQCVTCGIATTNPKFCSRSCAAKFNNLKRAPRSDESKAKTRASKITNDELKPKFSKVAFCKVCGCVIRNSYNVACSNQCRSSIWSTAAKLNPKMGGNKNTRAHGWYHSKFAGRVWLESSYEYRVAMELDTHDVRWTRPSYLPYDNKKYYPDFFLIDHNVYLDPKNDFLIEVDKAKISKAALQNNATIIILTKDQLQWNIIINLIQLS